MQQNQTPQEARIQGPIRLHFRTKESIQTAEGLKKIKPQELSAVVPKGAEIELRPLGISVKYRGRNYNWSCDSVEAVVKNRKKIQKW